jgi:hypothetical protein
MDQLIERCGGLDVHRDTVVACVRVPGAGMARRAYTGVGRVLALILDEQVAGLAVDMRDRAYLTGFSDDLVAHCEVLRGEVMHLRGGSPQNRDVGRGRWPGRSDFARIVRIRSRRAILRSCLPIFRG